MLPKPWSSLSKSNDGSQLVYTIKLHYLDLQWTENKSFKNFNVHDMEVQLYL